MMPIQKSDSSEVNRGGAGRTWRTRLGQFEWKASPYLYISPFFILFAIVGLFPLLYTMWIATRQFNT
ncbi:MAG: sugar ABC transporter permease, partial [Parascardovia denticolens]